MRKKLKLHSWQTFTTRGALEQFMRLSNEKCAICNSHNAQTRQRILNSIQLPLVVTFSHLTVFALQRRLEHGLALQETFGVLMQMVCIFMAFVCSILPPYL